MEGVKEMMPGDDSQPKDPIVFTDAENKIMMKQAQQIQANFLMNHPEITASTASDLAKMIREEKQMYSNLAIQFSVRAIMAMKKRNEL